MSDSSIHLPGLEITDPARFAEVLTAFLSRRGRGRDYAGDFKIVKVEGVFFAVDAAGPRLVGPFRDRVGLYRSLADSEIVRLPEGDLLTVDGTPVAIDSGGRIHHTGWDLAELVAECADDRVLTYAYESDGMAGSVGWSIVRFLGAYFITHYWDGWDVEPGPYPTFEAALEAGGETMRIINPDGNSAIRSSVWGPAEIEAHFTRWYPQPKPGQPVVVEVNGEECVWEVG